MSRDTKIINLVLFILVLWLIWRNQKNTKAEMAALWMCLNALKPEPEGCIDGDFLVEDDPYLEESTTWVAKSVGT